MISNELYHSSDMIFEPFSIKDNLFVHYNCHNGFKRLDEIDDIIYAV